MLDLISEEELNKQRSIEDIDKDPKNFKEIIEDKFLNTTELAKYYNCSPSTIDRRIKKHNINYKKKTTKQFRYEVKQLVGDEYSLLGEYINNKTKIKMKHNECGFVYKVKPNSFLNGNRCPKCNGKFKKTTEQFKQEVYDLIRDEYYVLGEYINNNTKIKMKHNECNFIYKIEPNNFLRGVRCPKCNLASATEIKIYDYLDNKFDNFKYSYGDHNCINKKLLRFDFFIDDINTVIEYDGTQHFYTDTHFYNKTPEYIRNNDKIKNQYCRENDIRLIRIPYWKKDCIEELLDNIFNCDLEQEWTLNEYWAENKEIDYLVVS